MSAISSVKATSDTAMAVSGGPRDAVQVRQLRTMYLVIGPHFRDHRVLPSLGDARALADSLALHASFEPCSHVHRSASVYEIIGEQRRLVYQTRGLEQAAPNDAAAGSIDAQA